MNTPSKEHTSDTAINELMELVERYPLSAIDQVLTGNVQVRHRDLPKSAQPVKVGSFKEELEAVVEDYEEEPEYMAEFEPKAWTALLAAYWLERKNELVDLLDGIDDKIVQAFANGDEAEVGRLWCERMRLEPRQRLIDLVRMERREHEIRLSELRMESWRCD